MKLPIIDESNIKNTIAHPLSKIILHPEDMELMINSCDLIKTKVQIIEAMGNNKIKLFLNKHDFVRWTLQKYSQEEILELLLNLKFSSSDVEQSYIDKVIKETKNAVKLGNGNVALLCL